MEGCLLIWFVEVLVRDMCATLYVAKIAWTGNSPLIIEVEESH
jgi:hypothetical protein